MALKSTYHRGKRVSQSHAAMLRGYERAHGPVYINQGRRTLAEQARFYRIYLRDGSPLAARPVPGAPHIKYGRENHALDINADVVRKVAAFYKKHGVPVAFNVANEPWHMDTLSEGKLKKAAKNFSVDPSLKQGQTGPSVVKLKMLLYSNGYRQFTGARSSNRFNPYFSKWTKDAVKRFQKKNGLTADGIVGASTWNALRK